MIDNIKLKKHIELIKHVEQRLNKPLKIFNLTFDPVMRNGFVISYRTKINNLFLLIRDDTLTIQNSFCKYYHEYNHLNFTYSQINQAVTFLSNQLGIDIRDARVIKFEFGVVIIDNNIKGTFARMGAFKNKEPHIMHDQGIPYGIYYQNTGQKIKIYSKSEETKRRYGIILGQNLLRVEKVYTMSHIKSLAKFKGVKIETLGDLCMRSNLQLIGEDLIESLSKIQMKNIPDNISNLTAKQIRTWGYFQDPYFRNAMKIHHFDAFKADRAAINKFHSEYRRNGQDQFIQEVRNKVLFCIEN